jgi:peptidoglycan hydrolase-like protein with peptidoglycan-binding domain
MTKGFLPAFCLVLLMATPALADTTVCRTVKSPAPVRHHRHAAKTSKHCDEAVRSAEQELADLGYYTGSVDCVMGDELRDAIKRFQRDHGLTPDGKLGPKTRAALKNAGHRAIGRHAYPLSGHRVTGQGTGAALGRAVGDGGSVYAATGSGYIDDDYAPRIRGSKSLDSRFAKIDVAEQGNAPNLRYAVNVNGSPILTAEGQPSVVSISEIYNLGDEEAVIFSTYSPNDAGCMFSHHVLAMSSGATQLLDLGNCTRRVDAQVVHGTLVITLPEHDDKRALGATWTLQGMDLERL